MDLPFVDDATVFKNVKMRMLSGRKTRMIGEDADPGSYSKPFKDGIIRDRNNSVFLRNACHSGTKVAAFEIEDAAITAARISINRAAVFG